jgi:hypothetical protein
VYGGLPATKVAQTVAGQLARPVAAQACLVFEPLSVEDGCDG